MKTVGVRDLAGVHEVCRAAGSVPRSTLKRWRRSHEFPQPVRKLRQGELWDLAHVRAWLACRDLNRVQGVTAKITEPGVVEITENGRTARATIGARGAVHFIGGRTSRAPS